MNLIKENNNNNLTKFETGAVRDISTDKEDYIESISWSALKRYADYMKSKSHVYGEGNWKKGIPIKSYESSLVRHLQKYLANKYDGAKLEPDEDHLSAILFNCFGIIFEEGRSK